MQRLSLSTWYLQLLLVGHTSSSSDDDVRRTISDLSLVGSCPEGVHDISVLLGSGLSPQLEAFMCSQPLPGLWESPLCPRCFLVIQKRVVVAQNWSRNRSILFASSAGVHFLAKYLQTFPEQSPRIAHVQHVGLFWSFKANAPVSVFLFLQRTPAQTRWPQTFGTVLSFVRLRQVASLVRIYSSAPLARCKQAKFYSANTALGSRSMRISNATK